MDAIIGYPGLPMIVINYYAFTTIQKWPVVKHLPLTAMLNTQYIQN